MSAKREILRSKAFECIPENYIIGYYGKIRNPGMFR